MVLRRSATWKGGVVTKGLFTSILRLNCRLSTIERTRSRKEPMLFTSSTFSNVKLLPLRSRMSCVSSMMKASGPQPNEVIIIKCMLSGLLAT